MATTTDIAVDGISAPEKNFSLEDHSNTGSTGVEQSVYQFLEKPIIVGSFNFGTSNLRNDILFQSDLLYLVLNNQVWKNKLLGMNNIKATVRLRLQCNASVFNTGGLLMHFIPCYSSNVKSHSGRFSLISKSQQPSILMDINTHGEVQMDIPYIGPTETIDMSAGMFEWGRAFISVYSPFGAGSAAPTNSACTLWMSIHDCTLTNPVQTQARGVVKGQRGAIKVTTTSGKRNVSEQELKPVSLALSAISSMATSLSAIPILTPISAPVAWFTNIASGVASAFGWSKPLNDDFGIRTVNGIHFGSVNFNGKDNSQPLGLGADNKLVGMSSLGGTEEDEMSFNFLKSVWSYWDFTTLSATDTVGVKKTFNITPYNFYSFNSVNGDTILSMTPIAFLSRLFRFIRGGVEIKFHFFKSSLHTGRVMFVFVPPQNTTTVTIDNSTSLHRIIVDFSETQETCFIVPYVATTDYTQFNRSIGSVIMFVLNPLRGPDSVPQQISVAISVRGAPDMEFQSPSTNSRLMPIIAQAGGDDGLYVCEDFATSGYSNKISPSSKYCVGEYASSLLQLMKRYVHFTCPDVLTATNTLVLDPYAGTAIKIGSSTNTYPTVGLDYFSVFSSLYLFYRGGMRFRMFTGAGLGFWSSGIMTGPTSGQYSVNETQPWANQNAYRSAYSQVTSDGGFSVQTPYYSLTYASTVDLSGTYGANADRPAVSLNIFHRGADSVPVWKALNRAVADDFQFSYFIGIPDMVHMIG